MNVNHVNIELQISSSLQGVIKAPSGGVRAVNESFLEEEVPKRGLERSTGIVQEDKAERKFWQKKQHMENTKR